LHMQGDAARDLAFKKIEEKLMTKGINLAVLDNQELAEIAIRFTGDAPPDHLPRETIIDILSEQQSVQNWALSVKDKIGSNVTEAVTTAVREKVTGAKSKTNSVAGNNPMAAQITERFGVWLKESGYTSVQLTQMLDTDGDGYISNKEASDLVRKISNTEPPGWVIDQISAIMDSNSDGRLSVTEWWAFLESIGFEGEQDAEMDEFADLEQELTAEKKTDEELARIKAEEERYLKKIEDEKKKKAFSGPERVIRISDGNQKEIQIDGTFLVNNNVLGSGYWISDSRFIVQIADWGDIWWIGELVEGGMYTTCVDLESQAESAQPQNFEENWVPESERQIQVVDSPPSSVSFSETSFERSSISTNNEMTASQDSAIRYSTEFAIEHLEKSRLSSESQGIIERCIEHTVVIKVEEHGRTLLASGQYRGGCTIQGEIDGGPYSAGIMLPAEDNELVESLKPGEIVTCQAKIVKWSSGSRQATLEGRDSVKN